MDLDLAVDRATGAGAGDRVLKNEVMRKLQDVAAVDEVVETPEDVADGQYSQAEDAEDEKGGALAAGDVDDVDDAVEQVTVLVTFNGSIDMFIPK